MRSLEKWLPWIVGGIALYFVWNKIQGAAATTGSAIGQGIVDVLGLNQTDVNVSGSFILPDGTAIPANTIAQQATQTFSGNTLYIDYNGHRYSVTARDASGNYPMNLVS